METPQRKRLYFVDGIIAGKRGPLIPAARKEGLIIFGQDPVLIDLAVAGIDWFQL